MRPPLTSHDGAPEERTIWGPDDDAPELPTTADVPGAAVTSALGPGARLDRFELRGLLGEGGMGRVHRAYDPKLDREVALKVLRHAATERGEAGLLREAQAMARLSHPNLLPVYDVGRHAHRLFIAMELVEGCTLAKWLKRGPSVDEVLRVMLAAGRGLEAAHRAGLVHRDFKPSNVMIGDDGRVRVMDLGLARLADDDSAAPLEAPYSNSSSLEVSLTQTGCVAGTPSYMAPEQHQGLPIDARADQYSFCVVLWEALFGSRPFRAPDLERLLLLKLRPPPPIPEESTAPPWLHDPLQRGLSSDPEDRFASMGELLSRLEPGLERRRRTLRRAGLGGLAAAGVLTFGLLGSPEDAPCQGARAKLDGVWDEVTRRRVEQALVGTGVPHAAETWQRLHPIVDDYVEGWSATHDEACSATRVRHEQPEAIMDARMRCLDGHRRRLTALVRTLEGADDKAVENAVQAAGSLPALQRCVDPEHARREAPVPDDLDLRTRVETLRDDLARASALRGAGRPDDALKLARTLHTESDALGYGPLSAEADLLLGALEEDAGHYPEAVQALGRAYFGAEDRPRIQARAAINLVFVLGMQQQDHEEAMRWAKHAEAAVERVDDDELRSRLLDILAGLEHEQGRLDRARELLEQSLALRERSQLAGHLDQASTLNNLGVVHYSQGRYDEALECFTRASAIQSRALGPRHPSTARSQINLGAVHEAVGRYDEALEHYHRALEIHEALFGSSHPTVAMLLNNIGIVHSDREEPKPALEHYRRALAIRESTLGPSHPDTAVSIDSVATVLEQQGDFEGALELGRRALAIREEALGPEHLHVAISLNNLGATLHHLGRDGEAMPLLERGLRIRERTLGPDHPRVASSLHNLGQSHRGLGRTDEALHALQRAVEIWEPALEPGHADLLEGRTTLGELLLELGRTEEAVGQLEPVLTARQDQPGAPRAAARFAVARALATAGQDPERARTLAEGAKADYESAGGSHAEELEAIDQWLRERGP